MKFVSLFAFVVALSLVSCGETAQKAEEVKDSVATAVAEGVEMATETVETTADSAVAMADSVVAAVEEVAAQ